MEGDLKKRILLIGGGGHCHSVLDSIISLQMYTEVGIVDNIESSFWGAPVVGRDKDIPRLKSEGWTDAFITVGSVGDTKLRHKLYDIVKNIGMDIPSIIDPSAVVARDTNISEGVYIGKKSVVNAGAQIGACAIINTGAIIEHDCIIGSFSHISPGSIVCGQVCIEDDAHVGAASVVRQQITIGKATMIGAGSVVVKNIPDGMQAYGNPCKVVSR